MPTTIKPFDSFNKAKYIQDYFHQQLSTDMSDLQAAASRHDKLARDHAKLGGNAEENEGNFYRIVHASASAEHRKTAHTLRFLHSMREKNKATPELENKAKMNVARSNEMTKRSIGLPFMSFSHREMTSQ